MAFRCIHINHVWCHYCAANQRIAIPLTQVFEYADIFITNRIIEYNLQEFQQKGSTTNWNCSIWQHQKHLEENQEPTISSTSNYPIRSRLHQQHPLCFLYENCSSWISLDSMTHQTSLTHPNFRSLKQIGMFSNISNISPTYLTIRFLLSYTIVVAITFRIPSLFFYPHKRHIIAGITPHHPNQINPTTVLPSEPQEIPAMLSLCLHQY